MQLNITLVSVYGTLVSVTEQYKLKLHLQQLHFVNSKINKDVYSIQFTVIKVFRLLRGNMVYTTNYHVLAPVP